MPRPSPHDTSGCRGPTVRGSGSHRRTGRILRPLAALLVLMVSLTTVPFESMTAEAVGAESPPAAGPATSPALSLELAGVSPAVAAPGDVVHVQAVLHNTGSTAVASPVLTLALSSSPVIRRGDVTSWSAGTDPATGRTLARAKVKGRLQPGASATLDLSVKDVTTLGTARYGVLPVSLQTTGVALHTYLGYQRRKEYVPLSTTLLMPVTPTLTPEMFRAPGPVRTAAWANATGESSRVARILDATAGRTVAWAIDPSLIHPPAAPADTSASPTSSATATSGLGAPARAEIDQRRALASRIRAQAPAQDTILLPYADADVAAVYTAGDAAPMLSQMVTLATDDAPSLRSRADIAWPATPPQTTAQRNRLASLYPKHKPAAVVVPASSLPPSLFTPSAAQRASDGQPLLAYDDMISRLVAQVGSPGQAQLTGQELIAATVALLNERPGTPRSLLIAPPRNLNPTEAGLSHVLDTMSSIPWLTSATVSDLVGLARSAVQLPSDQGAIVPSPTSTASPPESLGQRPPLLTNRRAREIRADLTDIQGISEVRSDGAEYRARWTAAAQGLTSVTWRDHRAGWTRSLSQLRTEARSARSALEVSSGAINFFAKSGRLQVTVQNHLDVRVSDVHVVLTPGNPRLRLENEPNPVRIGPGSRATVDATARALAAGEVPVTVRMVSGTGTPLGSPATLRVRVSPTGDWIYWVVGGVAVLLLVAGLWRSLRGGRRPSHGPKPGQQLAVSAPGHPAAHTTDHAVGHEPGPRGSDHSIPIDSDHHTDHPAGVDPHVAGGIPSGSVPAEDHSRDD